jgi:hypothetical protein
MLSGVGEGIGVGIEKSVRRTTCFVSYYVSSPRISGKEPWDCPAWIIVPLPLTSDGNGITIEIFNRMSKKIKEG